MRTPTIKEVREYFKNAEIVESLALVDFKSKLDLNSIYYAKNSEVWGDTLDGEYSLRLWCENKYAKIITYKNQCDFTLSFEVENGVSIILNGTDLNNIKDIAEQIKYNQ